MTDASILKKPTYFNAIDGLRLLASVNVVLFHLEYIGGLNDLGGSPGWLFRLIKGPAFHASLFFILGGFIFATKFAPKIETFKQRDFLKKRFIELYPLHLVTTLTMAALYLIRRWGTGEIDIPKLLYSLFMHLSFLWSFCPLGAENLNTPSWALSAMFLCYLLFDPLLKWSLTIKKRSMVMVYIVLFFIPLIMWGHLYALIGSPHDMYQFFHGFAPVRFFEFGMGVLLARLFILKQTRTTAGRPYDEKTATPFIRRHFVSISCDAVMLLAFCLIFFNLSSQFRDTPQKLWFSYHVTMLPLYMAAIYAASVEKGIFARIFSTPAIKKLGRTSFYPYLIHIPLMSIITLFCERVLGYKKFLHSPINIAAFMIALYGCSYLYVYAIRNKRRARKNATG